MSGVAPLDIPMAGNLFVSFVFVGTATHCAFLDFQLGRAVTHVNVHDICSCEPSDVGTLRFRGVLQPINTGASNASTLNVVHCMMPKSK